MKPQNVAATGGQLELALVHYPVVNKNGETIGSAVTNLDIHDIARAGRTFGIATYYIVTPYEDQQQLVAEILDHWLTGRGSVYNEKRKAALSLVRICESLEALYVQAAASAGGRPTVLATCARPQPNTVSYEAVRQRLAAGERFLLLFGTGWGLTPEVMARVDATLPPIAGATEYNHLSVRSAAAIVLDRVLGKR
ncbi:MAG: RNA methyltransferase [Thermodesulfobacteriota bacterium]